MAVTYEVERVAEPDPENDSLGVSYGWAHFHAFTGLAAEEGIELSLMSGYGGTASWASVGTPLRPIFDADCFEDGRLLPSDFGRMQLRAHEVCGLWSRGIFAGLAEGQMKSDQASAFEKLVAVIDACVETGRALVRH